ncbi:MAG: cytochrome c-type biogenesis protein [Myxococcota bacterium]
MPRSLPLALALALAAAPALGQPADGAGGEAEVVRSQPTSAELALAGRLLAPCCWSQTLDVHNSEPALELRREIRTRLGRGESAEAIEADIVARYGDRIRAVPEDSPLSAVAAGMLTLVGIAGIAVLFLGLRWRRRSAAARRDDAEPGPAPTEPASPERHALDARLDAELRDG